ncbi:MAG: aryl-sulfate sulfotransferase [Myxococcota bacterium]|nr:aryl-sulfate sulfotransferase [Myxococcota bacterium]
MTKVVFLGGLLVGCTSNGGGQIQNVSWERTDIGTVIRVNWTTEADVESWINFGPAGDCEKWSTPAEQSTEREALLLGLPSATDSCFQVVGVLDGETVKSDSWEFRTENLPAAFSAMEVESLDSSLFEEGFFVGSNPRNPAQVYVMDREGNIVWWREGEGANLSTQMVFADDKSSFSYNSFDRDFAVDNSKVIRVGVDGEVLETIDTPNGHHAFAWLPNNVLAYLAIDVRETDEFGPVVGDTVMVDDGTGPVPLYSTWDDPRVLLEEHRQWDNEFYPQGIDWTHANYLSYNEERNSLTISFANAEAVIEVDATTGEHLRSIGQDGTHSVEEGLLGRPHAGYWTDSGTLMVFTTPLWGAGKSSIGVELAFDDEAKTAEVVWEYGYELGYNTIVMGESTRMPNGNVLMNFGSTGIVEEVTPEGQPVWRVYTATGTFPGHWSFVRSLYNDGGDR